VKELLLDRFEFAVLSPIDGCLRPLLSRLRADHKPALGHTTMAQLKAVITRCVVERLPGVFSQRLANDLGDELEGAWNPRDKAELGELRGIRFAVELAIGYEITGCGRLLKGRDG
jgi:hypothetical protein